MTSPIDAFFAAADFGRLPPRSGPDCPSDALLAGYVDRSLTGADRLRFEQHALGCVDCHSVLAFVVELHAARQAPSSVFRVVARLLDRGLRLLNAAEHRLLPGDDARVAAMGGLRGPSGEGDVVVLAGPGAGLDELTIQRQPGGSTRLTVRGAAPADLLPDEITSLVFEADDCVRERRPFAGGSMGFEPLEAGTYRVRLVARAPGSTARELAAAVVELHD